MTEHSALTHVVLEQDQDHNAKAPILVRLLRDGASSDAERTAKAASPVKHKASASYSRHSEGIKGRIQGLFR